MKNIKQLILLFFLFTGNLIFSQAPDKISYQAVIRNASNTLITNQAVGIKISLLQGSTSGTAVYVETQMPTSNANGLVTIEIGGGTVVSGSMASINWANGPYFIKTETDPTGGSSYTIVGVSQLLSTPYALYAKTSGNTPTVEFIATVGTASSPMSIAGGTADVPFNVTTVNNNNAFNTTNYSYTVPTSGVYQINITGYFTCTTTPVPALRLLINGVAAEYGVGYGNTQLSNAAGGVLDPFNGRAHISVIKYLTAGQVLKANASNGNTANTLTINAGGNFSVIKY